MGEMFLQEQAFICNRLLMMDGGEIIYDVSGEEKQKLTLDDLAQKFKEIKKRDMTNDQMVLQ